MENQKETFIEKMQRVFIPLGTKLGSQRHLASISAGMMAAIPLTLLSAFINIIANPPVTADLIAKGGFWTIFSGWYNFAQTYNAQIMVPYNMTMNIFALIAVFGISFTLAKTYKGMKPLNASITAVVMFLMVATPMETVALADGSTLSVVPASNLGSSGLFTAMIVGLLSVEITRWVEEKHWVIKMPDSVPPNVAEPFQAVIPTLFNLVIWYTISLLCQTFLHTTLPNAIMAVLMPLFGAALNPVTMVIFIILACILWLFGIHGTNILFAALMAPLMQYGFANNAAYHAVLAAGGTIAEAKAALVLYPTTMFGWMAIGGTGGTLGLCILMMRSKSTQLSTIGKLAIVPGICGINEPITFGVPIVLNPTLAIPFVLTPVVCCILGYVLTAIGVLDIGHEVVMSLLPIGVGAFLSTGGIRNSIFEICLIPLEMLIYYPFFKAYEKQLIEQEAAYAAENA